MDTAYRKRKRRREVFEAAKSGDAVLLNEVLQEMNSSERTSALETKMDASFRYGVNEYGNFKVTPLIVAAKNGNVECVKVLLNYKAGIEDRGSDSYRKYLYGGYTPLFVAASYGHLDVLSCLVANGADVNVCTNDNCTPLMIASKYNHVNVVTFLIEHGANIDLKNKTGQTALHYAVYHNNDCFDVLSCLIKNGADVNTPDNYHNCTPLITASKNHNINLVTFLIEHGANVDLQDKKGETAVHHAVDSCDILSCLIANGADVNTCSKYNCTPLSLASGKGLVNVVTFLIEHGANVNLQDKAGKTALHYAVHSCRDVIGLVNVATFLIEHGANVNLQDKAGKTALHYAVHSCDILSCLIRNGADVNACTNNISTPLMEASFRGHTNAVAFLVECGANMDQQDKNGDTALHYAACSNKPEVVHTLLSLGASQLYNNKGLTPLLAASNKCAILVVEDLITRPECTKDQRIDALELLGASLSAKNRPRPFQHVSKGFEYMKRGMKERFADPSHPLLKQSMEPVEAYQNRKESQTLEELAQIERDSFAINMESLIVRERILGTNNVELLGPIRMVAFFSGTVLCTELYRHAIKIAQSCNQPCICDLSKLTKFLYDNVWSSNPPRQNDILELLEQTILEYEKQQKLRRGLGLVSTAMKLVQTIAKFKLCEEGKSSCLSVLLKRLCCLNPQDVFGGDTLLHRAVKQYFTCLIPQEDEFEDMLVPNAAEQYMNDAFLCLDTVKLLLNEGFNVNAVNNDGDTPLHIAVTFVPSNDELHLLNDMLEVLLDGGAHHDFVNNDGETAMDLAQTDEARMILSEKRKLELKCISARAVKKFGLPYLGVVPRILEKYISMH